MLDDYLKAFDITLSDARADEAHPAFTNLFVRAEWQASQQALVFARQPRLPTEHGLHVAHFLADTDPQTTEVRLQTDRQRWLGRNRAAWQPRAGLDDWGGEGLKTGLTDGHTDGLTTGLTTGLDPVCVLAARLTALRERHDAEVKPLQDQLTALDYHSETAQGKLVVE